jgi:hypothetical protein
MSRGRRKPYTERGIRRLRCFRCRKRQARQQWQICADGNVWRPICDECDLELNALVLRWIGGRGVEAKIRRYAQQLHAARVQEHLEQVQG